MINLVTGIDQRRNFSVWLRTGRRPTRTADGVELKFNPYHDPRNGQFTSGPGGAALPERNASSRRRAALQVLPKSAWRVASVDQSARINDQGNTVDALYHPDQDAGSFQKTQFDPSRVPVRSNSRAFEDPMTLDQAIPGLRDSPGGAVISLLDNFFDITGPANDLMAEMTKERSDLLISEIEAIDPHWNFQSLGFPRTWEGQKNQINDLRMQRAVAFARVKGDLGPLQVESARVMQDITDRAYDNAIQIYGSGRLKSRLSREEALGNYVDNAVRRELRKVYDRYKLKTISAQIRVNRRENDTSKSEVSYRLPDARVGDIAYDVTLSQKSIRDPQIRGFFNADFRPKHVVIIRPRQLGSGSSYIINRRETVK